jgi:SAM-dependent methyltransferase
MSTYYNSSYFDWQKTVGQFGGIANKNKFSRLTSHSDVARVLDFGCGGGYLLCAIEGIERYGFDINESALAIAKANGLSCFSELSSLPTTFFDLILSNHALEHVPNPALAVSALYNSLRFGGHIAFFVPLDTASCKYKPNDLHKHLYSFSPNNIGNLFQEAGFTVLECRIYRHKWPPFYRSIVRAFGWHIFHIISFIWSLIDRRNFQVFIIARKDQ